MSRCKSCNTILTEYELNLTNSYTREPEDLCKPCLKTSLYDNNQDDRVGLDDRTTTEDLPEFTSVKINSDLF